MHPVRQDRIIRFNIRDKIIEQIRFEGFERLHLAGSKYITFRAVIQHGPAVGKNDDHGLQHLIRIQIVQDDLGPAMIVPFHLVSADPVQQI
ncbi:hypothetical protein D3C75_1182850 [compost metagenome]